MTFKRGEIYLINFPYTFDSKYPNGKSKFVVILQDGEYFKKFNTVEILLVDSEKTDKPQERYPTDIEVPGGMTKLNLKSWVVCAQQYCVKKELFEDGDTRCFGTLSSEVMNDVDEALYVSLCMKLKLELEKEDDTLGNFLVGTLIGGVVGAIGAAVYLKCRDKNNENSTVVESEIDETEKVSISDENATHNNAIVKRP